MKCPYNLKHETHIQCWGQRYDKNEQPFCGTTVDEYRFELADCLKDECGAWQNGRCCYASVSLNNQ